MLLLLIMGNYVIYMYCVAHPVVVLLFKILLTENTSTGTVD